MANAIWGLHTTSDYSTSTNNWYRNEYYNLAMTSTGTTDCNTMQFQAVTFANAGNQTHLLAGQQILAYSGTIEITLQEILTPATITIASPGVVTFAGHGLANGSTLTLATTGALPTGLAINTKYFVVNAAANTFELSLTSGGASINTSGSQSGVHTIWANRTVDTWTINSTNFPDRYGPHDFALTSYAVDTTASKWRYSFKASAASAFKLTGGISGTFSTAVFCDTVGTPAASDCLVILGGKTLTFDASVTLGANNFMGLTICQTARTAWPTAPAAAYTLTFTSPGWLMIAGDGKFTVGTEANPIPANKLATVQFFGAVAAFPNGSTVQDVSGVYFNGGVEFWGAEDAHMYSRVATRAASGQKNIVLDEDLSAIWQVGDTIAPYGSDISSGSESNTYTIASISGTTVTTTVNLVNPLHKRGALVNYNRKANLGCKVTGSGIGQQFLNSGAYWGYGKFVGCWITGPYFNFGGAGATNTSTLFRSVMFDYSGVVPPFSNNGISTIGPGITGLTIDNVVVYLASGSFIQMPELNNLFNFTIDGFIVKNHLNGIGVAGWNNSANGTINDMVLAHCSAAQNLLVMTGTSAITSNDVAIFGPAATALTLGSHGSSFTNLWVQGGNTNNLKLNSTVDTTFTTSHIGDVTTAGTAEITITNYNIIKTIWNSSVYGAKGITNMENAVLGSFLKFDTYNAVTNDHQSTWKYGILQSTGSSLTDTKVHSTYATTRLGMRFKPLSSTSSLTWDYTVNTGNIQTYPLTISAWVNINTATYYAGTHTKPTLTVSYDNGTTSSAVAKPVSTATITIASPGVVTATAHGFSNGDVISFTTTGALPTGLTAATKYYIVNKTADTFELSATSGGSSINTSGSQSGTHSAWQLLSVAVTPATAFGKLGVTVSGKTDATGTNAYFYIDDFEYDYPTGYSANLGLLDLWADALPITANSDTTGTLSYDWNNDPYIVASEATALAYTGISLNYSTKVMSISSDHTVTQLYEYCKASARALGVTFPFSTTDGVTYNLAGAWTIDITASNVDITGTANINLQGTTVLAEPGLTSTARFANGVMQFDTPGTYDINFSGLFGTMTADFIANGSYNLASSVVDGTLHVDSSNDSTVTVVLSPDVTVVNDNPGFVTVDNALSVDVTITDIVDGSQVRVIETVSLVELANETAGVTGIVDFSYVWSTDVDISILIRKATSGTKYLEWSGASTITNVGANVQVAQVLDGNIEASSPTATGWSVDYGTKIISTTGSPDALTTGQLYTWLMDQVDSSTNMQYVNPMTCEVKDASYTLRNGYTLAANVEHYLSAGGVRTSDGNVIYTNVFTVGSLVASSNVYIKQNSAKISSWWSTGNIDVLIKVKSAGSLIDSGNLYFYVRKYGALYDYATLAAAAGGRQVVAVTNATDTNNTTASATVATYNDITITFGPTSKDLSDGLGAADYDVIIDLEGHTVSEMYEYLKYVTRDGETTTQNSIQGQLYLSANPSTYFIEKTSPFGTFAGGKFFGARGVWIEDMDPADIQNYQLLDADNVSHTPPAYLSVTNITAGSRIQVYNVDTATEVANEIVAGTTFSVLYNPPTGAEEIRIRLTHVTSSTATLFYEATIITTTLGGSLTANQVVDTVYADNGIDGSSVTEVSVSGTTIKIFIDDPDNNTTVQRIYNWYCYMLFSEAGIRDQGYNLRAVDTVSYRTYTSLVLKNISADPLIIGGGFIIPAGGGDVGDIFDTSGQNMYLGYNHAVGLPYAVTTQAEANLIAINIDDE